MAHYSDSFVPSVEAVRSHLAELRECERCPAMHRPAVAGRVVTSRILLVGQAPGDKEPNLGRPFAWTAGKTLFKWFEQSLGWTENEVRDRVYFAAVCRCFPGKKPKGGDRVPDDEEVANCGDWLQREFTLLQPKLVLPVGKLAIGQFLEFGQLKEVIGQTFTIRPFGYETECLPMPHPSGASTWHRREPGLTLLNSALDKLASHPAVIAAGAER